MISVFCFGIMIPVPTNAEDINSFFEDVSEDVEYYDAVKYMFDEEIIHGKDDGLFHPEDGISRVEALKIIFETRKVYIEEASDSESFPDIKKGKWYTDYVYTAKRNQTISGDEHGNFNPDYRITRAESCKIILGTYNIKLKHIHESYAGIVEYDDVEQDSWYAPCIGFMTLHSFFNPEGKTFNPDQYITRAEFAEFAYNINQYYKSGGLHRSKPYKEIENRHKTLGTSSGEEITKAINNIEIPDEYIDEMDILTKGIASYYGDEFNGRGTASGATFDNSKMMAAHPFLPFNSRVRVTNTENGKSVDVDVLDCGPFVKGRIIDLSKSAFETIGHPGSGLLDVEIEILEIGPHKWQTRCFDLTQARW